MNKLLRDVPYFLEVAHQKSFTAAADALDVPLSTLSRRVAAMEKTLGVRLLHRTTRHMELTESGRIFLECCGSIMSEMKSARQRLEGVVQKPSGRIRIALFPEIHTAYLKDVLSAFALRYPDIELHIHFATRWTDLYAESVDLEFRVGDLPDSDLSVRKIYTERLALYAAPGLAGLRPMPKEPDGLRQLPYISQEHVPGSVWKLEKDGRTEQLFLRPSHRVNNLGMCLEFALKGLGMAVFPLMLAGRYVKSGQLVQLLPDWNVPGMALSLVMPGGQLPHRVRLLIDYLVRHFEALAAPA